MTSLSITSVRVAVQERLAETVNADNRRRRDERKKIIGTIDKSYNNNLLDRLVHSVLGRK